MGNVYITINSAHGNSAWLNIFGSCTLFLSLSLTFNGYALNLLGASVTIAKVAVMEPTSDQEVTVATLTLTTSSGGPLEEEIQVSVIAFNGTASA